MVSPGFDRSLAIIIGINEYRSGISPLQSARADAEALAELLETQYQYQVIRLTDTTEVKPTLENIKQLLEQKLPNLLNPSEITRLLFYFAGHGIALNGEDGPEGYLIPQDAQLGNVQTYLPMTEVHNALLGLPCRHFLGILDCCFAGAFRWSSTRKLIPVELGTIYKERFDRFIQDPAWQVITSAASDQTALDAFALKDDRGQIGSHSPFAAALIDALSGKADAYPPAEPNKPAGDGIITATELYLYLRDRVELPTEARAVRQTPGICPLKKHDKGEFIFLVPGRDLDLPPAPPLDRANNPYRGLESFEEQHHDIFFGRKALTQQLYQFVTAHSFTVVLGASGSGKSSLVKAGLLPKLRSSANQNGANQNHWAILPPFRPGESPFQSLNTVLASANVSAIVPAANAGAAFTPAQQLAAWFQAHPTTHLLFVVDQFEELITLCHNEQERRQFLDALQAAITAYPDRLHVLITLRSDFEPQFRSTVLEPYWSNARFIVPALTREELREAIEEPASARVLYFDPHELVDQLIDEVANMPGALPLLSFALSELYLKYLERQEAAELRGETIDRAMTQADYEAVGGVTRSLTQRADQEYEELIQQDPAYAQTIRHVMLRMVAVGGELARRRVPLSELIYPEPENTRVTKVIQHFANVRLLISDRDIDNQPYVEPTHDALVRGWNRLQQWKNAEQENLALQRLLTPAVIAWKDNNENVRDLWDNNSRLDRLQEIHQSLHLNPLQKTEKQSRNSWLNKLEGVFVERSIERRRFKRNRIIISVSIAFSLVLITAVMALFQRNQAIQSQVDTLITLSESRLSRDDQLGALLASVQAGSRLRNSAFTRISEDIRNHAIAALRDNLYSIQELNRMQEHRDKVSDVNFSPDGRIIASASEDGTVRLWEINNNGSQSSTAPKTVSLRIDGQRMTTVDFSQNSQRVIAGNESGRVGLWDSKGNLIRIFEEHQAQNEYQEEYKKVTSVSFSPNGEMIASGSEDGTIQLRKLDDTLLTIFDQQAKVTSIRFSSDGQTLIAGDQDGNIKLWNIHGSLIRILDKHTAQVTSVDFNLDGQMIVSGSEDKTLKLWNVDGTFIKPINVPSKVTSVRFNPDGQTIATGCVDRTIRIWDLDGNLLQEIQGHSEQVTSISFSSNGQTIASGSWDGTVRLWDLSNRRTTRLSGHTGGIWGVSFSPNGRWLASAGAANDDTKQEDKTIRLWTRDGQLIKILGQHRGRVTSVDISSNGQAIVSGGEEGDNNIKLWSMNGELLTLPGHSLGVWSVQFSPDGQTIASASKDRTIKLWSLDGELLHTLVGHQSSVWGVSFSHSGQMLASASDDRTIRLWKTDGTFLRKLQGHEGTVITVQFSPDDSVLASGSDDLTIRLWKTDGTLLNKLIGHAGAITSLSFSSDGTVLASASEDRTIKIWRVSDGTLLQTLQGHQDRIWSIDFSPKDPFLASASDDRTIRIWNFDHLGWDLDSNELLEQGCKWLQDYLDTNTSLTDEQRRLCKNL